MKLNFSRLAQYPAPLRLGIFILTLGLVWVPFALPLHWFLRHDANLATIVTMAILFLEFLILVPFWGKKVHRLKTPFAHYGLAPTLPNSRECLTGLIIGLVLTFNLFGLMVVFGWATLHPSPQVLQAATEGIFTALGVGFAEELFFRGWFLDELERDYRPNTVLWANALIFAALHFIKPLNEMIRTFPQFPGLVLLGLNLVWSRWKYGSLGMAIGLHAGLIWGYYIINVGQLIQYTDNVSPWITGVDRNPLAGLLGLIFLGFLMLWLSDALQGSKP
ncbi:CPBP family intramembrane glutamic endopeptidase [Spirulina subsalsa]|uniref:CPBP family intramembrane glutamic endopeptidase n=1 Tax=Spirulina subsalsa TaxID=54311 RepID=UPI0004752FD2|nr:type II CAAX endopeptidase family protein [Spirulina subsalsa]